MNEIKCPNCQTAFQVDEAGFAAIVKQVRDDQFNQEIGSRLAVAEKEKESAIKLAATEAKSEIQEKLNQKEKELDQFKANKEIELTQKLAEKDAKISEMNALITNAATDKDNALKLATAEVKNNLVQELNAKDQQIAQIKNEKEDRYARPMEVNTWYDIWSVVNNRKKSEGGQTYDVYVRGGAEFPTQTKVYSGADFRMKRELPIIYFFATCNTGSVEKPYGNGGLRYDDLYMKQGIDLSSPLH